MIIHFMNYIVYTLEELHLEKTSLPRTLQQKLSGTVQLVDSAVTSAWRSSDPASAQVQAQGDADRQYSLRVVQMHMQMPALAHVSTAQLFEIEPVEHRNAP